MADAQATAIEGKVAGILNSRELVINRGASDGVKDGMRFEVIDDSYEILDPDTGEALGTIKKVKLRVKVSDIQPRLSIARTYETYETASFASAIASLTAPSTVTKVRTIRNDAATTPLEQREDYIKIGDKVLQIIDK